MEAKLLGLIFRPPGMNFLKVGQKKPGKNTSFVDRRYIFKTAVFLAHCHSVRFPGCFFIASFRNSVLAVQRRVEY